ncbi:MAG: site-specific integrase [Myxococcota bacterium]|nr:site-specific integrase [Myxococcota bacterium]
MAIKKPKKPKNSKDPKKLRLGPYHAEPQRPPTANNPHHYFRISYFEGGQRRSVTMPDGTKANGRYSTAEAKQRLSILFLHNQDPTMVQPICKARNIGELSNRYLKKRNADHHLSEKTKKTYCAAMRWLSEAGVSTWPVEKVESLDALIQLRDRLIERGLAAATIRHIFRILRMAVKRSGEEGWTRRLTMPAVKRLNLTHPKDDKRRNDETPERATVLKMLDQVGTDSEVGIAIHLQANLGARIGEIVSLKQDRIDLLRKRVMLDGKTGKRTVSYPDACHALLSALHNAGPGPDGRVFRRKENTLRTNVNRRLGSAADELGVPRFSSHGFRRRKATDLMDAGLSPKDYESFMGHSYKLGLAIYAQVNPDKTREVVNGAAFARTPPKPPTPKAPPAATTTLPLAPSQHRTRRPKTRPHCHKPLSQLLPTISTGKMKVILPIWVIPGLKITTPLRTGSR